MMLDSQLIDVEASIELLGYRNVRVSKKIGERCQITAVDNILPGEGMAKAMWIAATGDTSYMFQACQ